MCNFTFFYFVPVLCVWGCAVLKRYVTSNDSNARTLVRYPKGTMGTCSYVLTGTQQGMEECFGSTCHGAGRLGIFLSCRSHELCPIFIIPHSSRDR